MAEEIRNVDEEDHVQSLRLLYWLPLETLRRENNGQTNQCAWLSIEAVKSGSTILRAANLHGVPRQTLQDRISGRVTHGQNPGSKPYLSPTEEKDLAGFLIESAKVGYGKSRQQVKSIAAHGIRDKGHLDADKVLSNGWYYCFMSRQNELSLRKGDPTANV